MNEILNPQTIAEVYGMVIPLSILMIENEEDRDFMTSFYVEHRRFMLYLAKQRVGNFHDAEDIIEETVESLLGKVDTLKPMSQSRARNYLASAIRHTTINFFKRNAKHYMNRLSLSEDGNDADQSAKNYQDIDEYIFNRVNVQQFLEGFRSLSEIDRDLIMLRHYDSMSIDEIGELLSMDNDTVSSRLYKAKMRAIREAEGKKE